MAKKRKAVSSSRSKRFPALVFPELGAFYDSVSDYVYPFLRVVAGLMLIPHGYPKLMAGPAAIGANVLARRGIEPSYAFAVLITLLETVGGVCIAIGLFTRPIALLLVIEFIVIVFWGHWAGGWFVGTNGIEFAVLWGCVFLVILLRGGGMHSVDRSIGKEV